MARNETFFEYMTDLVKEARDSLGGNGEVHDPREYRFDVEFPDRRYAFQGYPEEQRIFVGQYIGASGVVWFDELRFDENTHGWRSTNESAWDFFRMLSDKPSLSSREAEELAQKKPQSGAKESVTSIERRLEERAHEQGRSVEGNIIVPRTPMGPHVEEEKFVHLARRAYRTYRSARQRVRQTAERLLRRNHQ